MGSTIYITIESKSLSGLSSVNINFTWGLTPVISSISNYCSQNPTNKCTFAQTFDEPGIFRATFNATRGNITKSVILSFNITGRADFHLPVNNKVNTGLNSLPVKIQNPD